MIEGLLMLSPFGMQKDNKSLKKLKRLREIALKKEQGMRFSRGDIGFLKSF